LPFRRAVLLALPAGNFGGLDFHPSVFPVTITGTGLHVTQLTFRYDYFTPLAFKRSWLFLAQTPSTSQNLTRDEVRRLEEMH
jgi:hypothetical protein